MTWQGDQCIIQFLNQLDAFVRRQHRELGNLTRAPMNISELQQREFDLVDACPRCGSTFDEGKHRKVRDHCHITGEYRGPLCHICNSKLRLKRRVLPVVFHNFKNYDAHMLLTSGLGQMQGWALSVIAQSTEKFMSLRARVPVDKTEDNKTVYFDIVFIDSYQFLSSALSTLAGNLDQHPITERMKRDFPSVSDEVLTRKGVFPYSYFSSLDKCQERSLPPRSAFRNDLSGEECSESEYAHAQRAWHEFKCANLGEYMLRYL